MAYRKFVTDLDLNGNQLKSAVVETLAEAPENPKVGQIYFNTTDNTFYCYSSNGWKKGDVYTASNPAEGTQGAIGVYFGTDNNNFKFRMLKANDQYLTIAEGADDGIIIFGVNVSELPVQPSVITKFEDYYTKGEVDAKISGIYRIKGTVDYYNELPDNAETGDVWLVRYKGESGQEPWSAEFAWIVDEWDELGSLIDLSAYEILNADTTPSEGVQLYVDANGTLHVDATGAKANWEAYGNGILDAARIYTDNALDAAKAYSDQKLTESKNYTDAAIEAEVQRSNEYSNNDLQRAKEYADDKLAESKQYTDDKASDTEGVAKRYTDSAITNVKQWTRERLPEVVADDGSVNVETVTENEKNTYRVKVADTIQQRLNEVEGRSIANYYSVTISKNTEGKVYFCTAEQHGCGDKVMAQVLMNNIVVELNLEISNNGNVRVSWKSDLPDNLRLIVMGLTEPNA